jgi:hypothetical protein
MNSIAPFWGLYEVWSESLSQQNDALEREVSRQCKVNESICFELDKYGRTVAAYDDRVSQATALAENGGRAKSYAVVRAMVAQGKTDYNHFTPTEKAHYKNYIMASNCVQVVLDAAPAYLCVPRYCEALGERQNTAL